MNILALDLSLSAIGWAEIDTDIELPEKMIKASGRILGLKVTKKIPHNHTLV